MLGRSIAPSIAQGGCDADNLNSRATRQSKPSNSPGIETKKPPAK